MNELTKYSSNTIEGIQRENKFCNGNEREREQEDQSKFRNSINVSFYSQQLTKYLTYGIHTYLSINICGINRKEQGKKGKKHQ